MHDSVTTIPAPIADTPGAVDDFDYVDGAIALVPHGAPSRVPRGAPVVVQGWAAQPHGSAAPRDVRLLLDDARQHGTTQRAPRRRRDAVGERFGGDAGERTVCDFRGVVPTADVSAGAHAVRVVVLAHDDQWYEAAAHHFTVEEPVLRDAGLAPGTVRVRLEPLVDLLPDATRRVAANAVPLGHTAIVTGWALDAATRNRVHGVQVTVGGRHYASACNLPRADVRHSVAAASDLLGFDVVIPTEALGAGEHAAIVEAIDADGHRRSPATPIVLPIARRPSAFPHFATITPLPPACDAVVRVRTMEGDTMHTRVLRGDAPWTLDRDGVLEVSGFVESPWGGPPSDVYVELRRRDALVPTRVPALTGYGRADTANGSPFSGRLSLLHEPAGTLELAVLTLGADRRVYARALLGTILLGAPVQPSERDVTADTSRRR